MSYYAKRPHKGRVVLQCRSCGHAWSSRFVPHQPICVQCAHDGVDILQRDGTLLRFGDATARGIVEALRLGAEGDVAHLTALGIPCRKGGR